MRQSAAGRAAFLGVAAGGAVDGKHFGRPLGATEVHHAEAEAPAAQQHQRLFVAAAALMLISEQGLAADRVIDTEVGKRWLWLISALVMVLGILVVVAAYIPR